MASTIGRFEVMVTNVTVLTRAIESTLAERSQDPSGRGGAPRHPPAQLSLARTARSWGYRDVRRVPAREPIIQGGRR